MKTGILLLNVGTPDDPAPESVGRYLKEFLVDPDVIDLPLPLRWFLVNVLIVPKRKFASAEAYQKIWTERGSPLKYHMEDLKNQLQQIMGDSYLVEFAMRYQNPSIGNVLSNMKGKVSRILAVPLYPQYSLSATASAEKEIHRSLAALSDGFAVDFLPPFYRDPDFVRAFSNLTAPFMEKADHLLFSFHGLPSGQIKKMDSSKAYCLKSSDCCKVINSQNEKFCYRAQCFETARAMARALSWPEEKYSVGFQSRLNKGWIQPYTDEVLPQLARQGVKNLVVVCPSFTTDCLETIEEIGIRAKEQFLECGGEELHLVPCLNASPVWVDSLSRMIQRRLHMNSSSNA